MCPPLSEHESGLGLRLVVGGGGGADDDGGPTVPPQRILKDSGHFTVSVRDITLKHNKTTFTKRNNNRIPIQVVTF